ncbi:MAG: hypothetical protein QOE03_2720 [Micromonosporaceae bacterium]|nr:hypothetical protein [Micromonosporaceae bacterium]
MSKTPRPLPVIAKWPTFPFEGDLNVRELDDPVPVEPPRHGDDPSECRACHAPDEAYIWVSERWRVRGLDRPTGLPMVLILESRSHLDLGDLTNMLAAELGVMTVRLERAVRSLDGVARVHVNRWGDGAAHLHLWFLARPYGRLQLRGSFLSLWDQILPPISEHQWRENLALVAAWLADFGGRSLAEPPRIDWKAPALFSRTPSPIADEGSPQTGASDTGVSTEAQSTVIGSTAAEVSTGASAGRAPVRGAAAGGTGQSSSRVGTGHAIGRMAVSATTAAGRKTDDPTLTGTNLSDNEKADGRASAADDASPTVVDGTRGSDDSARADSPDSTPESPDNPDSPGIARQRPATDDGSSTDRSAAAFTA